MKIICISTMIIGLFFTPILYVYINPFEIDILIFLLMISMIIFFIGWVFLIETNSPTNKYNPFTVNPKWKEV